MNHTIEPAYKKQAARIITQPQDVKGKLGEQLMLSVKTEDDKARMQFELTEGRIGMKFRCKITGEDGNTVYTNVVTAEKKNEIIIKNQPQDVKGGIGEKLTLDVQADGVTSYQWQYSSHYVSVVVGCCCL